MNAVIRLQTTVPHLRLIMTDHEDRQAGDTIAPDTDRAARETEPPGEADAEATRVMTTMVPPATTPALDENGLVPIPSSMPELLYNQLMLVHQKQTQRDHDLLDTDGRYANLVRNIIDTSLSGFALKLDPRFVKIEKHLERLQRDHEKFKAQMEERLAEMASEIDALKVQRDAAAAPETTT